MCLQLYAPCFWSLVDVEKFCLVINFLNFRNYQLIFLPIFESFLLIVTFAQRKWRNISSNININIISNTVFYCSFKSVTFYYSTPDLQVFQASDIEARKDECASEARSTARRRKTLICLFLVTQILYWLPAFPEFFLIPDICSSFFQELKDCLN